MAAVWNFHFRSNTFFFFRRDFRRGCAVTACTTGGHTHEYVLSSCGPCTVLVYSCPCAILVQAYSRATLVIMALASVLASLARAMALYMRGLEAMTQSNVAVLLSVALYVWLPVASAVGEGAALPGGGSARYHRPRQ